MSGSNFKQSVLCASILSGVLLAPGLAAAQSVATEDEVVVTAQRREQRLQDVPVAVTALSEQALETNQLNDVYVLQHAAPNLTIGAISGDPSQAIISIRGPTNFDATLSLDPATGIYLDGVYIARAAGANMRMVDIQRAEVLRGPQGTLFGRNTIGGAINIIPNRPSQDFEGSLEATAGNFNFREFTGVLNVPVGEDAAFRIVAQDSERDGYATSSLTGDDLDADDTQFVRAQFLVTPTSNIEVLLSGDYTQTTTTGQWVNLIQSTALLDAYVGYASGGADLSAEPYIGRTDHPAENAGGFDGSAWGLSGQVTVDMGDKTFRSISAYRSVEHATFGDADATPYLALQTTLGDLDIEQVSQEFQLFGTTANNRLDWITGLYVFSENGHDNTEYRALYGLPPNPAVTVINAGEGQNDSWAAYVQGTYEIMPDLRLTAGVRYTEDHRELTLRNRARLDALNLAGCTFTGNLSPPDDCVFKADDADFSYVPWTVGLDYRLNDDVLFYGKFSRGFRSGGINVRAGTAATVNSFDPEQMDSWEVGVKSDLFNRMLRFNASAYLQDYKDVQIAYTAFDGATPTNVIDNSGDTQTIGIEIEATLHLHDLTLGAVIGTMDAEYTRSDNPLTGVTTDTVVPYSPEFTGTFTADYAIHTELSEVNLHVDYSYRDDAYTGVGQFVGALANLGAPPDPPVPFQNFVPAYGLVNGMVTFDFNNSPLQLSLWGRNLTDEEYFNFVGDFAFGVYGNPGAPRTYGATLKYAF